MVGAGVVPAGWDGMAAARDGGVAADQDGAERTPWGSERGRRPGLFSMTYLAGVSVRACSVCSPVGVSTAADCQDGLTVRRPRVDRLLMVTSALGSGGRAAIESGFRDVPRDVSLNLGAARQMSEQIRSSEGALRVLVQALRLSGCSWSVIAAELGVSRQAAQQRYGADRLL